MTEEYLHIQILKGDIYTLEEFLLKTTRGLQPHLKNEFIGRDEEFQRCIKAFEICDIIFLTGGPGVGKSKFAVHLLEEFSKNEYHPIVIQSSGVSLWDDYAHLFHQGKKHVILFDDASKALSNLIYLLSKIDSAKTFSVKLIITSRDYLKQKVEETLINHRYEEINVPDLNDEEIEKIITAALPNLKYHHIIKEKIIDLAKGNARIALMATYSMVAGSEINYLNSPVLLYERYFDKIAREIGIFNRPIILQSIAIVSFFGVIERDNLELKKTLADQFDIDWNELWSSILELHQHEIVDVYEEQIVKVSDQILSTYAFYKCFLDEKKSAINYSSWISVFIHTHSDRIRTTLIDVNNTFGYEQIRSLTELHLNALLKLYSDDDNLLYNFYKVFWYYKSRECLLYLKNWIDNLETKETELIFSFSNNDHTRATKYFELLIRFWNHSSEWIRASLELSLNLISKEPNRLPETIKFLNDHFKYTIEDVETGYLRQNILLDVLNKENVSEIKAQISSGILINIAKLLLGWRYTEMGPLKGSSFTMRNFYLFKSDSLLHLRRRILEKVLAQYDPENIQLKDILNQLMHPGGDIDNSIYANELDIYEKLILEKLDSSRLFDCKFVEKIAGRIVKSGHVYPESWELFIQSDIRKISKLFRPCWETRDDKSIEDCEAEKRQEIQNFVNNNTWEIIEEFLFKIDHLNSQEDEKNRWHLQSVVSDIYLSISQKDKGYFEKALSLFFGCKVTYTLRFIVLEVPLRDNLISAKEILKIIDDHEFSTKPFWKSVLIRFLPADQASISWLKILIALFKDPNNDLHIVSFKEYEKFWTFFENERLSHTEMSNHNVITYLTWLLVSTPRKNRWDFGFHFFSECASYFKNHIQLFEDVYLSQCGVDQNFDHDGKELKAVLDLNKDFINHSLKNDKIGVEFSSSLKLENFHTNIIWDYPEYETMIENIITTILEKASYLSLVEGDIESLFKFREHKAENIEKSKGVLLKMSIKHRHNNDVISIFSEIVYDNYREWFIEYLNQLLLVNKNPEMIESVSFGSGESWSGSRVPVIQSKMEFYQQIHQMISSLPDVLDYSPHLDFIETKIEQKKKEIIEEQKRDFRNEYN